MRIFLAALILCATLPVAAAADMSTTPGYTAHDQAQFAKLAFGNGSWTCVDTPASKKPDLQTQKQVGNWYVLRETGDDPNTLYLRWSHDLQAYIAVEIDDSGATSVATSKANDPYNGAWTFAFPANIGSFALSTKGKVLTIAGTAKDAKGKTIAFKSVCTKS